MVIGHQEKVLANLQGFWTRYKVWTEPVHPGAAVNKDKGTPHVLGVILHLLRMVKVQLVMG